MGADKQMKNEKLFKEIMKDLKEFGWWNIHYGYEKETSREFLKDRNDFDGYSYSLEIPIGLKLKNSRYWYDLWPITAKVEITAKEYFKLSRAKLEKLKQQKIKEGKKILEKEFDLLLKNKYFETAYKKEEFTKLVPIGEIGTTEPVPIGKGIPRYAGEIR